jgi:hemoglobin
MMSVGAWVATSSFAYTAVAGASAEPLAPASSAVEAKAGSPDGGSDLGPSDGDPAADAPRAPRHLTRGPTLYSRLGGESGVTAIADTLIDRTVADPLTGPNFKGSNLARIKRLLAEQICDLADGPCRYSGDSMKEVHAGHEISEAMFYRMVEILRTELHERGVDQRSINQLLRLLAPMKRDVVERPAAKPLPPAAP